MSDRLWKKIDSNQDTHLWEATTAAGVVIRLTGLMPPHDWLLEHHAKRFTKQAPELELGARGWRIRMPDESEWREYGYEARALA